MKVKNYKEISESISKGRQSVLYMLILKNEINNKVIKIEIKSDSVSSQCSANSYVFSNDCWNLVHYIPYSVMKTKEKYIYLDKLTEKSFKEDKEELLRVTLQII